jgi:hypothetical protein
MISSQESFVNDCSIISSSSAPRTARPELNFDLLDGRLEQLDFPGLGGWIDFEQELGKDRVLAHENIFYIIYVSIYRCWMKVSVWSSKRSSCICPSK